jgi:hypothetical protein
LVIDRLLGSSEAALHSLFVQPLAQQADPVATPEQLAFENEGRHAKNARGLGFVAQVIVPGTALARQERREAGRRACLGQQRVHGIDIFRIELAPPEAVEGEIVVGAKTPCFWA